MQQKQRAVVLQTPCVLLYDIFNRGIRYSVIWKHLYAISAQRSRSVRRYVSVGSDSIDIYFQSSVTRVRTSRCDRLRENPSTSPSAYNGDHSCMVLTSKVISDIRHLSVLVHDT